MSKPYDIANGGGHDEGQVVLCWWNLLIAKRCKAGRTGELSFRGSYSTELGSLGNFACKGVKACEACEALICRSDCSIRACCSNDYKPRPPHLPVGGVIIAVPSTLSFSTISVELHKPVYSGPLHSTMRWLITLYYLRL